MTSRAMRGLGVGLAQVGEMLLSDALLRQRDEALARLRGEEMAQEREFRKGERAEEQKFAAGENAKNRAAMSESAKNQGRWQPIYEEQVITDPITGQSSTVRRQVGTFNELTNEHRYYKPADFEPAPKEPPPAAGPGGGMGGPAKPTGAPQKPWATMTPEERANVRSSEVIRDTVQGWMFEPISGLLEAEKKPEGYRPPPRGSLENR